MAQDLTSSDAAQVPTTFELTLQEYCLRLSTRDRRVELIAGFHHEESAAGQLKDSETAFQARFNAYCTQPA